jgi:hypothetical protein
MKGNLCKGMQMREWFCEQRPVWCTYQAKLLTALLGLAVSATLLSPASAATIGLADSGKKGIVLAIAGVITTSDAGVVDGVLQLSRHARRPVKIVLIDSPGGEMVAGLEIADQVHRLNVPVLVLGKCLSACAFIALAARSLTLRGRGLVGVHQSYDSFGTPDLRATRFAARLLRRYGASGSAILKMLDTPPDQLAILSRRELHGHRVR